MPTSDPSAIEPAVYGASFCATWKPLWSILSIVGTRFVLFSGRVGCGQALSATGRSVKRIVFCRATLSHTLSSNSLPRGQKDLATPPRAAASLRERCRAGGQLTVGLEALDQAD